MTAQPPLSSRQRTPDAADSAIALELRDLTVHFPIRKGVLRRQVGTIRAVDGVDLTLHRGETLGLVGESGCGKSTTGRAIMRLEEVTSGQVLADGVDITHARASRLQAHRRNVQIVFQDPYASLSPRSTVAEIVAEPLRVQGLWSRSSSPSRISDLLRMVGLDPSHRSRYPHQFSGGQRQRISIARALAMDPSVLVLDEPVSALDVSVRAQVINRLKELQRQLGLSYLFISHDLSVVRHMCDRVAVMYLGRIVEIGTRDDLFGAAAHPYTHALLSAIPVPDPTVQGRRSRIVLRGDVPSPAHPPSGCRFRTRCWRAQDVCATSEPTLAPADGPAGASAGHLVACHFPVEPGTSPVPATRPEDDNA
jgi:peptide/nickel transport system ATP-binding protein/oligopeptide transport system ATP-binding protein